MFRTGHALDTTSEGTAPGRRDAERGRPERADTARASVGGGDLAQGRCDRTRNFSRLLNPLFSQPAFLCPFSDSVAKLRPDSSRGTWKSVDTAGLVRNCKIRTDPAPEPILSGFSGSARQGRRRSSPAAARAGGTGAP